MLTRSVLALLAAIVATITVAQAQPNVAANGGSGIAGNPLSKSIASTGLTIGSTTITGGTNGRIEFNNNGFLGEKIVTGSGDVVLSISPTLITPNLGTPTVLNLTNATNLPASGLGAQAANTVLGNATNGSASPTALPMPGCPDTSGQHLNYTAGTGFTCGNTGGGVNTTGSPQAGNLAKFSGPSTITNADLSGDVTTSGSTVTTLASVNGTPGTYQGLTVNGKGLVTAAGPGQVDIGSSVLTQIGQPNDNTTGTTLNKLVKASGTATSVIIGSADVFPPFVGICISNCSTGGSPTLAINGTANCVFDGPTTAGHYVVPSTTANGSCHDGGASVPANQVVVGIVLSTNGTAGTYQVNLNNVGVMSATSAVGTPGGVNGQLQINNSGAFGGGNLSGDVTTSNGTATTLATVNSNVGTFQGLTLNAKGLVTAAGPGRVDIGTSILTLTGPTNDAVTGTVINKLVKQGSGGTSTIVGTGDVMPPVIGICVGSCGTFGQPVLAVNGTTNCVFDGSTTAGDYVVPSTTTAGGCHDAGASVPSGQVVIGTVQSSNVGAGAYAVNLNNVGVMAANQAQISTVTNAKAVTFDSTVPVTAQTIKFPVEWATYRISEIQTSVAGGGSFTAGVQINGSNVTSCSAITVSGAGNTGTTCTAPNTGVKGDQISIVVSAPSGTVNTAYISVIFVHSLN